MEKIQTSIYGKVLIPIKHEKKKVFQSQLLKGELKYAGFCILAYLCGQVAFFNIFNPVGITYLATFFFEGTDFYLMALLVTAGFVFGGNEILLPKYILCIAICSIINFVLASKIKKSSYLQKSFCGFAGVLLSGIIYAAVNDMSRYLTFTAIAESIMVFSLTFVMCKGLDVLKGSMKRKIMTSEEVISVSVVLAGAVAGAAGIYIGGVSIKILLAGFIILIAGYRGGAGIGSAAGVLIGFVLMMCGEATSGLVCVLSVSGLLCGAMRDMGKFISLFSFITGIAIIGFYLEKELLVNEFIMGILIASIMFLLIPKRGFAFINTFACYENEFNEDEYFVRMKKITEEKLKGFAKAFYALSKTFCNVSEKKSEGIGQKEVAKLIDEIAGKVCDNCGLSTYCWKTDFYNTYQTIFSVLSICDRRGQLQMKDIPKDFAGNCVKLDLFLDTVNRMYEIYKTNIIWESKLEESRELVSEQLKCVAGIMDGLSKELDVRVIFKENLEKAIRVELDKSKIETKGISVQENINGNYEVKIVHSQCLGKRQCASEIIPISGKVLGRKMKRECTHCITDNNDNCVLKLVEENRLKISTGVASATKEESDVSGDSYSFMEIKDGSYMLALSDGMGSGKAANSESTSTIELLEQFIESGFEKDLALKMINSVLILKSNDESFATLDICSVNLYTGMSEFIKIGAASAFLVRDEKVKAIRSSTLPVGVLKNIDAEKTIVALQPNDIIVMVTDGVADIIEKDGGGEVWLEKAFGEFKSNNPQDIAEYILIQVKKTMNGVVNDDMTVMAARIWGK